MLMILRSYCCISKVSRNSFVTLYISVYVYSWKEFRCFEAKIEESEKAGSHREWNPGHLAWAASALLLSHDNQTTTSPHNPLYVRQTDNHQPSQSSQWQSTGCTSQGTYRGLWELVVVRLLWFSGRALAAQPSVRLRTSKFSSFQHEARVLSICVLFFTSGTEVQEAQEILQNKFLKVSSSKRKLWSGAPKLSKFNRKFGIVQNAPLLSELDYTSCYEMMDQFPSEIQELSIKSVLNKVAQRETRVFVFKGPPGCGKTELMSRVCSYWARHYALRGFTLVLYVNVWDVHQGCSLQDLIDRHFKGSTAFNEKICHWIKEEKGNGLIFLLDGFCHEYLDQSPIHSRDVLHGILSGTSDLSKSTVVIATTCSGFVKPLCYEYIQFEILGLSGEQIGKQVVRHFDKNRAADFLMYLAGNPEVLSSVSSPSFLVGTMYIFTHISDEMDLPMTLTQLYTSLVVLVNEWHKGELTRDHVTNSLQTHFKNILLENSRKIIEVLGNLLVTIARSLIHDVGGCDHVLQDHNSAVPNLQYFVFSLLTVVELDYKEEDDSIVDEDEDATVDWEAYTYFWYFLAGFGVETNSNKLLKQYYKRNILKTTNCLAEAEYVTPEQQADLSSLTAEVSRTVVTTRDIHSILHCLPYLNNPHAVVLNKCFLGTQAIRELSRFLAVDSWTNEYSGIKHLW